VDDDASIREARMSGLELQKRLNVERPGIPIVFITAHSDDVSRQRALNAEL
jgi:FixJ family two-component response regulator